MIGPSPDWFSGMYSFSPIDPDGGVWLQEFSVATAPFDAGTEMGDTYSISNLPQRPPDKISQLTVDTVPANGIFLDRTGTKVQPVAMWSCILQSVPPSQAPPATEAGCLKYATECRLNEDCCSGRCRLGVCRIGNRDEFRISDKEGSAPGIVRGATGRDRNQGGLLRGRE